MNGKYYLAENATKSKFLNVASNSKILHLATHAQANDKMGDFCFLIFSNRKDREEKELLYAREIYNLQLKADLVTLSACETGLGELKKGEGIISLARAFAYAGAKSIVTSLWQISDVRTKDLMISFYKNLHNGLQKDDALWKAKMDYLHKNKGEAASPFYWASFIGIGDMSPLIAK
jgi:CHAT domain-containing protein